MNVNDVKTLLKIAADNPGPETALVVEDALKVIVSLQEVIGCAADALEIVTAASSNLSLDTTALCHRVVSRCREWT